MSTTISSVEELPELSFLGHLLALIVLGILGTVLIWTMGTDTVTKTQAFWVPAHAKYVNDVDGTYLDLSTYTAPRPVATISLDNFRRIADGRETKVAVSNGYVEPNVYVTRVHYTTIVNGVNYYTMTDFSWWRADTSTWRKDGTVSHTGRLIGGAIMLIVLWWVLMGYVCLMKCGWLHRLHTNMMRRLRKNP